MKVRNAFYRLMAPEGESAGGGGKLPDSDPNPGDPPDGGKLPDPPAPKDDGKNPAGESKAGEPKAGDPPEGDWSPDWRNKIAGGDEKMLARLSRYSSPKDVANALLSVQNRIGAGELRSTLPKNANEEQVKQWRAENGIPEAPDKYDLKLADGLVVAPEDKPLIDNILAAVHKANGNNTIASELVNFYYDQVERTEEARLQSDKLAAQTASDALHAEWGPEFRPNLNMIEGLLDTMPQGTKDLLKFGRLSDQTPIMAHPDVIRWLNTIAREINPVTTVIPNAGANISGAIDDEIKKIESNMGAPKGSKEHKAYWDDAKAQDRYRQLLEAKERSGKKAS